VQSCAPSGSIRPLSNVIVAAYVAAATLELVGIMLVVWDVSVGVRRGERLVADLKRRPHVSDNTPPDLRALQVQKSAIHMDNMLGEALHDLFR
jgi:hypothetical protein